MEYPEKSVSITYRVPYADTDMMGVVYYGNYLTLFERCRNELMRETSSVTYRQMEEEGAMLPVVEAHVDYKKPARYDDLLKVTAWVDLAQGVKLRVRCAVERDGELLASGYTLHCCVNAKTMHPMRVPSYLAEFGNS